MLRIRFSRTGKVGQPSYRIVVADHRTAVKGKYIENLGHFLPARNPAVSHIKKDRVAYWISKGAIPSDSVASLLKKEGLSDMDRYLEPRNKKRASKGEEGQEASAKPAPETTPAPVK